MSEPATIAIIVCVTLFCVIGIILAALAAKRSPKKIDLTIATPHTTQQIVSEKKGLAATATDVVVPAPSKTQHGAGETPQNHAHSQQDSFPSYDQLSSPIKKIIAEINKFINPSKTTPDAEDNSKLYQQITSKEGYQGTVQKRGFSDLWKKLKQVLRKLCKNPIHSKSMSTFTASGKEKIIIPRHYKCPSIKDVEKPFKITFVPTPTSSEQNILPKKMTVTAALASNHKEGKRELTIKCC